jgi:2-dehydro-3-deoxygluconokinase
MYNHKGWCVLYRLKCTLKSLYNLLDKWSNHLSNHTIFGTVCQAKDSAMPEIVTFGEIMLRLKPAGIERFCQATCFEATFGGGEANVAVALAQWGHAVGYVTRLPNNELGDACLSALRHYGVQTQTILRGGDRLGIYFLEAGASQRPSKVLYDRAGSAFSTLKPGMVDWKTIFQGGRWFHWTGISPAVSESAARVCKEAVLAARQAGLTISCDLNYRAKLWKWTDAPGEVMAELVKMCDVATGNEEDAEKVFGIKATGADVAGGRVEANKYRSVCEQLAARMPNLKAVAVTLRGSLSASHNTWSGVLWQDGRFLVAPTYDIQPVVDRVGAGDAFAAGLIHGLLAKKEQPQQALNFAVAAGCLKHSITGDWALVSTAEVEQLMKGNASGRVIR